MAMTVSTNVSNKPKPKKKAIGTKLTMRVAPQKGSAVVEKEKVKSAGKETKTYTKAVAYTGDKRYGKDNPSAPQPKHVLEAQKNKQDISFDKEGKPYRAGFTTTKKSGPVIQPAKIEIKKPKVSLQSETVYEKTASKKPGKLKPMAMTYGTDDPKKGGGTKYKMKVRAKR